MTPEDTRDTGARVLLIFASTVVVIAGMKAASSLILPFLSSLFIAMISLPLLNWLRSRRVPTPAAVVMTLVAALSVLVGVGLVVGGSVRRFTDRVPKYQESLNTMFAGVVARFLDQMKALGFDLSEQFSTQLINPSAALDVAQGALATMLSILSNSFLVILTITFILFEAAGFPDKLHTAFGMHGASHRYEKIKLEIQKYLGIKTLVSLVTGALVTSALAIIGVDFPFLWGMLAFLLNFIPTLGSMIAAVPPVLLAIVQLGPGHAVAVAVVFLVVNVLMGNLIEPYLMGRRLGLSTLVVFMSLVFWGWVWGPMGMLLSVPLTMMCKIMLENTEDLRWIAILLGPNEKPLDFDVPGSASE
jgi:predicted PurR-regulated permease PerM